MDAVAGVVGLCIPCLSHTSHLHMLSLFISHSIQPCLLSLSGCARCPENVKDNSSAMSDLSVRMRECPVPVDRGLDTVCTYRQPKVSGLEPLTALV